MIVRVTKDNLDFNIDSESSVETIDLQLPKEIIVAKNTTIEIYNK